MAMTITEANDTQTLLSFLFDPAAKKPDADRLHEAAKRLADRSSKVLMAGRTGEQIEQVITKLKENKR